MNPFLLRAIMHVGGLVFAAVLFIVWPFSPVVNGLIAMAFWIQEGIMAEFIFRMRATSEQRTQDLRDRVDNPPS